MNPSNVSKYVRQACVQLVQDLSHGFERRARFLVFQTEESGWRKTDFFGESGVSLLSPPFLEESGQLFFQRIGRRAHPLNLRQSSFRLWNIWLALFIP
jgi:hypothetical protein